MEESTGCNYNVVISIGIATFAVVNRVLYNLVPTLGSRTKQQKWKFVNVATSLVHSLITGIWAPTVFFQVSNRHFLSIPSI